MAEDTIFDKIIAKESPAKIVYEDDDIIAFHDINPQAPVHVLVIPKKKIESFDELDSLDIQAVGYYFKGITKVARKLGLSKDGYRIVFNCGRHANQTVKYIHAHILGGRPMTWPPG